MKKNFVMFVMAVALAALACGTTKSVVADNNDNNKVSVVNEKYAAENKACDAGKPPSDGWTCNINDNIIGGQDNFVTAACKYKQPAVLNVVYNRCIVQVECSWDKGNADGFLWLFDPKPGANLTPPCPKSE